MAESEKPHLPADGQCGALSIEAARQVLCRAPSDSAGADEVCHADVSHVAQRNLSHLLSGDISASNHFVFNASANRL